MTSVKNNKSVEKLYKILSPVQREILVGTLLGDAHLRANKKKSKYQYVVLQSGAHKEYVFHLYEIFKNYTSKGRHRQKSILLKIKDFQVNYILDGVFILLIKNVLDFMLTNFIQM